LLSTGGAVGAGEGVVVCVAASVALGAEVCVGVRVGVGRGGVPCGNGFGVAVAVWGCVGVAESLAVDVGLGTGLDNAGAGPLSSSHPLNKQAQASNATTSRVADVIVLLLCRAAVPHLRIQGCHLS
jgi:hypothetical protein